MATTAPARPVAIVTDGMYRKSLAAIRALGKAGYDVHVFGDSWLTVGFWSRYTRRRVLSPDAKDQPSAFGRALVGHLQALARTGAPKPVLLPMEDDTLEFVLENDGRLSPLADYLIPGVEAFAVCSDKGATMALAERLAVPHPQTQVVSSAAELLSAAARMAGSPFVVKPVRGSGSRGVRYDPHFTPGEAEGFLREYGPSLVQERIPPDGDAIGVSFLFDRSGRPVAHFCHKRLRQFPNNGGPSTDRIAVQDERLTDLSLRLLKALGWKGVAMVEWKTEAGGRNPKLLEINPRFWGSLQLAIRSGVDFPALYARAAADQAVAPVQQRVGVRCRWLIPGDILRWLTAKRGHRESLRAFCTDLGAAEEWDASDVSGFLSCIFCQGLSFFRPKYFKLLIR